jgi:hypothetical protein
MKKISLAVTALAITVPAFAQTNPAPTIAPPPTADEQKLPRPLRAHGIPTALAVEAALAANASCAGNTYKTTAMITDSAGVPDRSDLQRWRRCHHPAHRDEQGPGGAKIRHHQR